MNKEYNELSNEAQKFFWHFIGKDWKKYLALSCFIPPAMWGGSYFIFTHIPFEGNLIPFIIIGFFDLISLLLIVETIKKKIQWRPDSFIFLDCKIVESYLLELPSSPGTGRNIVLHVKLALDDGRLYEMNLSKAFQNSTNIILAGHKKSENYYAFDVDNQRYVEMNGTQLFKIFQKNKNTNL